MGSNSAIGFIFFFLFFFFLFFIFLFLARLDEVQEELLYYPSVGVGGGGVSKMLKLLRSSFLCDGQGAVR